MPAAALTSWILLRLLRSPAIWLVCLALFGGVLLVCGLRSVPTAGALPTSILAWAFPAALIGVSFALATLSEGASFLARVDPTARFFGGLGALVGAALYLQCPILAAALLSGLAPADVGRSSAAILSSDLELASVALLLLHPPLSTALRTSAFLVVVTLLPALAAGDGLLARPAAFLDAGAPLRLASASAVSSALAAGSSLALLAYLLRTRPARAPAP